MLMMVAGRDPAMLHALGVTPGALAAAFAQHKAAAAWADMAPAGASCTCVLPGRRDAKSTVASTGTRWRCA
jgi:hypothetical protein